MVGVRRSVDHPGAAQTQIWFVDACRQRTGVASRFDSMHSALNYDVPNGRCESSNQFLSAITGHPAYARPDGQTLFCEALYWVLSGKAAATPRANVSDYWHVSTVPLLDCLPARLKALEEAEGADQTVVCSVRGTATIPAYAHPPIYSLTLAINHADASA